ncbi:MAG: transposase [Candidatus Vogelbacteria bacterium]|nr:transposase [Candidatus Vogelbacteria bacterium]
MRLDPIETGEIYHVYNRGVDKRQITLDTHDSNRFVQGLIEFNTTDEIGSLRDHEANSGRLQTANLEHKPLVEILSHCLNPNHFHLILRQLIDNGVSHFMRSQIGGYARYFNKRHNRSGALFEGRFKAKWIEDEDILMYKSVYVNQNDRVHRLPDNARRLVRSSNKEYLEARKVVSDPAKVLSFFENNVSKYQTYSEKTLIEILEAKRMNKELEQIEFND